MKKKASKLPKQKLLIVFMLFIFLFSIIKIGSSFASTDPFSLTNVSISNISETAVVNSISYEKTAIKNDITFHKVGDTVTYKITVVNNESENYTIKSLTDDNTNEYITYEYSSYEGTSLNSKEEKTFEITAKYANEVTDMTKRDQSFKVTFTFTLEDSNGAEVKQAVTVEPTKTDTTGTTSTSNEEMVATSTNPKTGDNIYVYITTAILSVIALVMISRKNKIATTSKININNRYHKKGKGKHSGNGIKFFSLFLALAIMLPSISKAANNSFTVTIENTYRLYDKCLITSYVDGNKTEIPVTYNETSTDITTPEKAGYTFVGWTLEDGTEFDINTPITEDITIIAKWEDARSDIEITVSDEDEWKPSKTVTITYDIKNNDKEYVNEYSLDGGITWNTYTGEITLNENNVEVQARTRIIENDEIIGTEEKTVTKIDPVVPTISIDLGSPYYSGQALDLASVTTTTYGESGATVKWTIEDIEITNMSETNKIDKMDEQYEAKVVATITTGAGLTATATSQTIIIKYARWNTYLLDGVLTKENIQNIKFCAWDEKPENPTGSFDNSVNQDGAVMEYYVLDPDTNLYDIYITSPYGYSRYYSDDMRTYIGDGSNSNRSQGLFSYLPNMISIDFEYLDMYNITNTAHLFDMVDYSTGYWECNSSLKYIKWGDKFNTINVTDMSSMFAGLDKLESIDLENFNVKNVTDLNSMFARCEKLETIEVSTWDTSSVTSMMSLFYQTKNLKNLDVSNWDTTNVTDMRQVFYESGIENIDLSKWDTSKVTSMRTMFANASNLKSVDVSNWNTLNVTDMAYMFYGTTNLTELDLSSFNTSNVTDMYNMFRKCKVKTIDFRHVDLSNVSNLKYMFAEASNLKNVYVEQMPTYKSGAQKNYMWTSAGTSNFTVKEYDD